MKHNRVPGRVPESPRLIFRAPTTADSRFILKLMNQPDYHEFIGDRGVRTLSDAEVYVREKLAPPFMKKGFGLWLVIDPVIGDPIGFCGLVDREHLDCPDLGYALLDEYQGKGYATEAARAVLSFSQTQLGMTRLLAVTSPHNAKSASVLTKAGFTFSGNTAFPPNGDPVHLYEWFLDG
ncbi:GNAT family N-acetyltransferase [Roseibium sp. RKSG952]|uniref:GNAT family N-acetyltransferase n=1 Tax=Roseibium sp. RKSG952 TaxID=2529384 RepID=UPI0012BBDBF5|nr:GNAT family N-acetyltransferase [Roseibium sp. RKSG952]MTI01110.1 N-acetyltransferase [Roseibium sp. RKSG952]